MSFTTAAPHQNEPSAAIGPDRIWALGDAFRGAKTFLSAVELGVFTELAQGALDFDELRSKIDIAERGARDFFDALVALGVLDRDENSCYRNMPDTDLYLDRRKPTYIGGELEHFNRRVYPDWNQLTLALRTGKPQSGPRTGSWYPSLYADEAALENFAKGMTGGSLLAAKQIAAKFPWHQYKTLVDIGTAQGCLPVQIAQAHPHLTGVGFDLPQVRSIFEAYVRDQGVSARLRFSPGDFFTDPLPQADVIVFGRILQDWDLSAKKMLLKKTYESLANSGVVLVCERLIDDERQFNATALLASLNMLIMSAGGFVFTGKDCVDWMQEAGFRGIRVEPLDTGLSMVIGIK